MEDGLRARKLGLSLTKITPVLILVLMKDTLGAGDFQLSIFTISESRKNLLIMPSGVKILSEAKNFQLSTFNFQLSNPCFCGGWSWSKSKKSATNCKNTVLILVLLEDGLGACVMKDGKPEPTGVLILVFVEDSLGEANNFKNELICEVS